MSRTMDILYSIGWHGFNLLRKTRTSPFHHLTRMHLVGDPSAPTSLRGKQCNMYIPASTSSRFRPWIGIMSLHMRINTPRKSSKCYGNLAMLKVKAAALRKLHSYRVLEKDVVGSDQTLRLIGRQLLHNICRRHYISVNWPEPLISNAAGNYCIWECVFS
jgi:hypothetical protein